MTKEEIIVPRPEKVRLQKTRFSLLSSGNALITFAVWTAIRSLIQLYYFLQTDFGAAGRPLMAAAILAIALGAVDLVLKLIVGFSARAEGLGKHRKSGYIVLGIILAVMSVLWLIGQLPVIPYYYRSAGLLSVIVSIAVEGTVLFAELDLVVSAIRVRKIEQAADAENEGPGRAR